MTSPVLLVEALKPERLGRADIRILVALAEPAHTIRCIVHLFAQKPDPDPDLYASPVEAANDSAQYRATV